MGLPVSNQEKFLAYIMKAGPPMSESLRLDRRPRLLLKDGQKVGEEMITRLPLSWEECHEVLCELESVKSGSKAYAHARAAGMSQHDIPKLGGQNQGGQNQGFQQGDKAKGKGDKNKGKGKGKDGQPKPKSVCFNMRDTGTCVHGKDCKFSHDPRDTGRPSGAQQKAAAAKAKAEAKAAREAKTEKDSQAAGPSAVKVPHLIAF